MITAMVKSLKITPNTRGRNVGFQCRDGDVQPLRYAERHDEEGEPDEAEAAELVGKQDRVLESVAAHDLVPRW